jgi:hypothetical protein
MPEIWDEIVRGPCCARIDKQMRICFSNQLKELRSAKRVGFKLSKDRQTIGLEVLPDNDNQTTRLGSYRIDKAKSGTMRVNLPRWMVKHLGLSTKTTANRRFTISIEDGSIGSNTTVCVHLDEEITC